MKDGPVIARVAALIGDPARSNILAALMSGKALTVSELAHEAGVTLQTASAHLSKLLAGKMVTSRKQGRHRYFELASPRVAQTIEALMGLAAESGQVRSRTGPRDEAMRTARRCYNHLAGAAGVQLYDSLVGREFLAVDRSGLALSANGRSFVESLGVDVAPLLVSRAPVCRDCLDWSERRSHLAGSLGRALLELMIERGWLRPEPGSRAMTFMPRGRAQFEAAFPRAD